MPKQKSKKKLATVNRTMDSAVKTEFIRLLKSDGTIDWDRKNLSTRTLALDILYLLGIAVDKNKYTYLQGFKNFSQEVGIVVDLKAVKHEEILR